MGNVVIFQGMYNVRSIAYGYIPFCHWLILVALSTYIDVDNDIKQQFLLCLNLYAGGLRYSCPSA